MQLLGEVAVVKAGRITHHWTARQLAHAADAAAGADAGPTLPRILRIDPTAIAGAASQVGVSSSCLSLRELCHMHLMETMTAACVCRS